MRKILMLCLVLAGCAGLEVPPKQFVSPDGKPGWSIYCGNFADCYTQAGASCPSGYSVMRAGPDAYNWNTLVVECK